MSKEEAIQTARRFLDSCYEYWDGAQHCISECQLPLPKVRGLSVPIKESRRLGY
jgi:hypothetical protein